MQVADDQHANIHRNLHRLLDVLKPSLDSAVKFGDGLIMEEEGARIVDCQAQLAAFDLRYTPRSLRSWDSLASAPQPSMACFMQLQLGQQRERHMQLTCAQTLHSTPCSIMHVSSVYECVNMWALCETVAQVLS